MSVKKIGIIGATGYTGSELVAILKNHAEVEISVITSESRAGEKFSDVHPQFTGIEDQKLLPAAEIKDFDLDLVFLALPHGVSMDYVNKMKDSGLAIIDLSGDFRLDSAETYEAWYPKKHVYPEGIKKAAYGLPELFRKDIKKATLIANPGCFPTGAILGLAPLLKAGLVQSGSVIVDAKTGVTGAGIKPNKITHYSNVNENFKAYGLKKHRHTIEIEKTLERVSENGGPIQFTPHLLPVDRGILSTMYATPSEKVNEEQLRETYQAFYRQEPFVRLRESAPAIKDVRGTNFCDIFVTFDERTNRIIVISAIDNLVKGAAGQAVHNMNIFFGLDELTGLTAVPLNP